MKFAKIRDVKSPCRGTKKSAGIDFFVPNYSEDYADKLVNSIREDSSKIKELIETQDLKEKFQFRRQQMLSDKIDVSAFFVWFIENYPESAKIMKENPDYQYNFKY